MWSSAKSKMLVRREILHSTPSCWYFFVEYPIEKYRKFHSKSFLKRPREKYVHSRNLECDHLLQFNTAPLDSGAVNNESGRDTLKARHLAPINGGLRLFFFSLFISAMKLDVIEVIAETILNVWNFAILELLMGCFIYREEFWRIL